MAREIQKLTEKEAKSLSKRPGRHGDGGGLAMVVTGEDRARWVFRYTLGGKVRDMGLGAVGTKDTGLAEARRQAEEARKLIVQGTDPLEARAAAKAKAAVKVKTFGEMADDVVASLKSGWRNAKHAAQWKQTLSEDYCRSIRNKSVDKIGTEEVLEILKPVWAKHPVTANRLRGRIERVLSAARAAGYIQGPWSNPAMWRGHLENLLPRRKKVDKAHHAAMVYTKIPALLTDLQARESNDALALQLVILTACRTTEVRLARPSEFDLDRGLWTIPAPRMKAGVEHRVPLSPRAVEIARELIGQGGEWLIPGSHPKKPIGDAAMLRLLKSIVPGTTVHGLRSAFRTWADEIAHAQYEIAEACLAHTVGSEVSRAYARSDLLERRRKLMEAWATYCATLPADNLLAFKNPA